MTNNLVRCRLLTTRYKGTIVSIPKIACTPADGGRKQRPRFTRHQFPLRLAFSMTINKVHLSLLYNLLTILFQAQGQTFDRVGVILSNNVFAHGQLYVALSRVRSRNDIRVSFQ